MHQWKQKQIVTLPCMDKNLYPVNEIKYYFPWLFAVSAAKSITLFGGLEIMKVDLSYFYRASSTKTEIPMVVNQDFST